MTLLKPTISLLATTLAFAIGGCSTGPELGTPISVNSSDRVAVRFVHAYRGKHGIEISGQVRRKNNRLVRGHIHVEALGRSGEVLARKDAYLPMMVRYPLAAKSFGVSLVVEDVSEVERLLVEIRTKPDL